MRTRRRLKHRSMCIVSFFFLHTHQHTTNTWAQDPWQEKGRIVHCMYYTVHNRGGILFYCEIYSYQPISFSFFFHYFKIICCILFVLYNIHIHNNRIKRDDQWTYLFNGKESYDLIWETNSGPFTLLFVTLIS